MGREILDRLEGPSMSSKWESDGDDRLEEDASNGAGLLKGMMIHSIQ